MDAVLGWKLVVSLPAILLIALLAGRLLGVSPSLAATALAGAAGWLSALALSLAIAEGDPAAAGFTRNLWVFAIVFTMSATVWIELLATPGALARAQSGLVSIPRPLRAVRRSSQRLSRYAQITGITVKHGFGPALGLARPRGEDVGGEPTTPAARRLWLALEECGGMFVKLGQLLSTRADLLPAGVVAELARLQDKVTPAPTDAVRALLEAELGCPVEEAFAELDAEPIAAASIGQAYRGRLRSGEAVIVKVQRPGIAEAVERDLLVLAELARVVEARTAWGADYHVAELSGEFADRLREELDFRLEARNATEIAAALDGAEEVHVPVVHRELSTARVLVMEWLDGVSAREVDRIDAMGLDRARLSATASTESGASSPLHGGDGPAEQIVADLLGAAPRVGPDLGAGEAEHRVALGDQVAVAAAVPHHLVAGGGAGRVAVDLDHQPGDDQEIDPVGADLAARLHDRAGRRARPPGGQPDAGQRALDPAEQLAHDRVGLGHQLDHGDTEGGSDRLWPSRFVAASGDR